MIAHAKLIELIKNSLDKGYNFQEIAHGLNCIELTTDWTRDRVYDFIEINEKEFKLI